MKISSTWKGNFAYKLIVLNQHLALCLNFVSVVTGKKVQGSQETQQKPPNAKRSDRLKSLEVKVVQRPV